MSSSWIRKSTRYAIYDRDSWCCVYCGEGAEDGTLLTLDHLQPRSLGGNNKPSNLVTCCFMCNSIRKDQPLTAFIQTLPKARQTGLASRIRKLQATSINRQLGLRIAKARHGK